MRQLLKWMGLAVAGLAGLVLVAAVILYAMGRSRVNRQHEIPVAQVAIPDASDTAALARGEHLVTAVIACGECHGVGLGGNSDFFNDPAIAVIAAPNLTSGAGGIGDRYTDEDWVRAIRHGLGQDGRPLIVMPSQHFQHLSEQDLGAMIAYLKTLPPVDNATAAKELAQLTYILIGLGVFDSSLSADLVDHDAALPAAPPEGETAEYGEYLVTISTCTGCHGEQLAGGQAGPGEPIAPNLTPGGDLADWSEGDFITLMRTGQTPEGEQVDAFMPWRYFQGMTDEELTAMWLYLQALPALEYQGP